MPTNFPSGLDNFTNPSASDNLNSVLVPHADQHANANDAIEALEAKVGVNGSLVTGSLDYRVTQVEGNTHSPITLGTANGLSLSGQQLSMDLAGANATGTLSAQDWNTFNGKQSALSFPLSPALGGTGIGNAATSTLTLVTGTTVTAKIATLTGETNVKGTFINDALTDMPNPDMGYLQTSNLSGYYTNAITDKSLSNVRILQNSLAEAGAIRTTPSGTFGIYLNSRWNDIVVNFVLRENSAFEYALEHAPVGFNNYIEIMSGNSNNNLGLNGKPLTQGYSTSMGAYPVDPIIDGGSF